MPKYRVPRHKRPIAVEWRNTDPLFASWGEWAEFRRYADEKTAQAAIDHFKRSFGERFEFRIASQCQ